MKATPTMSYVEQRRKRLGLSQTDVADRLGLDDYAAVSYFESGRRPLPHGRTRDDYERLLDELEGAPVEAA